MPGPFEITIGRTATKLVIALPLAYLSYTALMCPCTKTLLCCHLTTFKTLLLFVTVFILIENRGRITTHCGALKQ